MKSHTDCGKAKKWTSRTSRTSATRASRTFRNNVEENGTPRQSREFSSAMTKSRKATELGAREQTRSRYSGFFFLNVKVSQTKTARIPKNQRVISKLAPKGIGKKIRREQQEVTELADNENNGNDDECEGPHRAASIYDQREMDQREERRPEEDADNSGSQRQLRNRDKLKPLARYDGFTLPDGKE